MNRWRKYWPALALLLILSLVAVVRIRLLSLPLERDEGEYACAGQLMLEGVPPYQLIYNMKMPGTYAAYALIMALFGQTGPGIRLGFILVNLADIVLVFFLARHFLSQAGAVAAGGAYALLSLSPHVQGLNAHASHFVVLPALGATLLLLRALKSGRQSGFFWSGSLFGLAFLMKQPGGAFAFFGASIILWTAWRQKPPDWRREAPRLALYAAGVAAPIALTAFLLWRAGVWNKFWWWTIIYARTHATALNWAAGRAGLVHFFVQSSRDALIWVLALAGLVLALAGKNRADEKFFLLSLLFFSAATVVPTLYFTSHYFVMMLPVVAILAAKSLERIPGVCLVLFCLACAYVAWPCLDLYFSWAPEIVDDRIYFSNNFAVYPVIADYLKSHTAPTATFAILGSEPELLFYARRRSVTGYIYMYDLVQNQPFRQRMEKEMIAEVERARPDYVVFVNNPFSWLPSSPKCFDEIRDWFMPYTQSQYDPFGVVTFKPNQYVWGPDCLQAVPLSHRFVVLFQRKPPLLPKSAP